MCPPSAGTIELDGLKVDSATATRKQSIALRRNLSFVFQNYALFANKMAQENISEALITVWKQSKPEANTRALEILEEIGLVEHANHYPSQPSGSQQQRIGIGRAMATQSQVILFDEPTSALDPEWLDEVLGLIKRLAELHHTMVIVTHEIEFARDIADRVIFMAEGKIIEQGPTDQLISNPKDPRTQRFLGRILRE
ncbi:amino acid ABC transporter ATP-binding protein [Psychromonas sp.]|uniref:amino acid ABC transporter ATP-binding protein n=1 Tax=Psychromonas sp. TaxID=1884585 RepID=UPI003566B3B3